MALKDCKPAELDALASLWARQLGYWEELGREMKSWPKPGKGPAPSGDDDTGPSDAEMQAVERSMDRMYRRAAKRYTPAQGLEALKAAEAAGAIVVAVKRRAIYVVDRVDTRGEFKGMAHERLVLRRADLKSTGGRIFEDARQHPAWADLEALQRAKRRAR